MTAAVIFQGRSSGGSWPLLCDHSQKSAFMGPGRGRFFRFTEFPVLPAMLRKVKTANHQLMLLAKAFLIYLHPQFIHPGNNVATGIVFFSSKFYAQYGAWTHDSWDQKSHAHWLSQLGAYNCIFWWLEQEAKVTGGKRSDLISCGYVASRWLRKRHGVGFGVTKIWITQGRASGLSFNSDAVFLFDPPLLPGSCLFTWPWSW